MVQRKAMFEKSATSWGAEVRDLNGYRRECALGSGYLEIFLNFVSLRVIFRSVCKRYCFHLVLVTRATGGCFSRDLPKVEVSSCSSGAAS